MANSYVCSGATMRCTMGTSQARLTVLPIRTVFLTGKPQANISDHISFVNLGAFGRCRSLGFPATAAATAAAHGKLTPMPCMHNTPFPWMGGKNDYIVKGDPALLKSSTCQCIWGGTISLVTDGQTPTGPADLSHLQTEKFEKDQVSAKGLSTDEVLDGIQMALDVAGMVPLAGAVPDLLNAAISACRGNWADAGLSLLAAVPGVGDVAGGAKIVKNGVKIAKNVKKGAEATETVTKIAKRSEKLARDADNIVSMAEKRTAKFNKQIVESDKIAKLPVKDKPLNNDISTRATQNKVEKRKTDIYTYEKLKVEGGKDQLIVKKHTVESTTTKKTTILDSTNDSGKIQKIQGSGSVENYNVGHSGADANSNANAYNTAKNRNGQEIPKKPEENNESIFTKKNESDCYEKNHDNSISERMEYEKIMKALKDENLPPIKRKELIKRATKYIKNNK